MNFFYNIVHYRMVRIIAYLSQLMEVTWEWGEYEMDRLEGRIRGTATTKGQSTTSVWYF